MANIGRNLRGLVLSASELKEMTDWPEALIEDYLNIIDNLINVAGAVDEKNDFLKTVNTVTFLMSPYDLKVTDEEIFLDTNEGQVTVNLPPGTGGQNYRLLNVGRSGNNVVINPSGADLLFGENSSEYLEDTDVVIITYDETYGWY